MFKLHVLLEAFGMRENVVLLFFFPLSDRGRYLRFIKGILCLHCFLLFIESFTRTLRKNGWQEKKQRIVLQWKHVSRGIVVLHVYIILTGNTI